MSEPKIIERFIGDNQIENIHISPSASIDFGNPISESRLNLNYPAHPEDSTLVLGSLVRESSVLQCRENVTRTRNN